MTDDPGYAICHAVIERDEATQLLEALSSAPGRTRAGARHLLGMPAILAIAEDVRLRSLAAQFVGPGAVPFRATLFDKSPSSNWLVAWHQDTALPLCRRFDHPEWGPWSVKDGVLYAHAPSWALEQVIALRVSLDDSTATNGPLRVLPDTHRLGVLSDGRIQHLAASFDEVPCLAPAGGVVAMRPLIVHASSKAIDDQPRRVLHIVYAASLVLSEGVDLAVG